MGNDGTEQQGSAGPPDSERLSGADLLRAKIVEHLSAEIVALTAFQVSHRIRMSFSVLIGPFVVLGSFLVATDGSIPDRAFDALDICSVVLATLAYVGLALYGAAIDQRLQNQCNVWRAEIARIWRANEPSETALVFELNLWRYYLPSPILMLLAFVPITFICVRRLIVESVPILVEN